MGLYSLSISGGGMSLCISLGLRNCGGLYCRSELDLATVILLISFNPFNCDPECPPLTMVCKENGSVKTKRLPAMTLFRLYCYLHITSSVSANCTSAITFT